MDIKFYCSYCGQHIEAPEEMIGIQSNCPSCQTSVVIPDQTQRPTLSNPVVVPAVGAMPESPSKFLLTFFFSFFLGVLGIHRFYLGKIWTGLLQLATFGGLGLWTLVDIIRILLGKFKDRDGKVIPNIFPKISWSVFFAMFMLGVFSDELTKTAGSTASRAFISPGTTTQTSAPATQSTARRSSSDKNVIAAFQEYFNGDVITKDEQGFSHPVPGAQCLFDLIHPIGTGKSVTVNDLVWNKDASGNVQSVGLDLTLYWQGPLKSGSTEFKILYDAASEQFGHITVIRSDGVTRENIRDFAVGYQIGSQLHEDLKRN